MPSSTLDFFDDPVVDALAKHASFDDPPRAEEGELRLRPVRVPGRQDFLSAALRRGRLQLGPDGPDMGQLCW